MLKTTLIAAGALLALPVFAQNAVNSASGVAVTSGTGVVVTPSTSTMGAAPATVTTVAAVPSASLGGAAVVQAGSSETVNGNTRTVTTRYWVNVPAGVEREAEFQRWQRLR